MATARQMGDHQLFSSSQRGEGGVHPLGVSTDVAGQGSLQNGNTW